MRSTLRLFKALPIESSSHQTIDKNLMKRTIPKGFIFSGDVTAAPKPNGATELFFVKRQRKGSNILYVNYFNFKEDTEVPFKIIVAREYVTDFGKNYMVNPNNLIVTESTKINKKQKILGLVVTTTEECRFYFVETSIGNSISSKKSKLSDHSRQYLFDFYEHTISLEDILIKAGAEIVREKNENVIDLSPEALEKDSILNLLV